MAVVLECLEEEKQQGYLLKHLMLKLASVLVKLKSSILLNLCNCEESGSKNHYDLWKEQKESIAKTLGISFKELKDTSRGKQVLFYNSEILFNIITQPENFTYLEKFGYSTCESLEDCLEVLKARFCLSKRQTSASNRDSSSFPHEIGIFLGYPLKDVRGFIEKESLPLAGIGRWQVFGDSEKSLKLMSMHKKAEGVFLNLIKNGRNPILFIERVSLHFKKINNFVTIS